MLERLRGWHPRTRVRWDTVKAVSGARFPDSGYKSSLPQPLEAGQRAQDYVVLPHQEWLDGTAAEPGKVRQFVAMPLGTGYPVDAQATGEGATGGLQFEITRLALCSDHDASLVGCQIQNGDTVRLILRLREGGECPPSPKREMNLAAGGAIEQGSVGLPQHDYQKTATVASNVQTINSASFQSVTGVSAPQCPISATTYAKLGLPFSAVYGEATSVVGDLSSLRSVAQIDGTAAQSMSNLSIVNLRTRVPLHSGPSLQCSERPPATGNAEKPPGSASTEKLGLLNRQGRLQVCVEAARAPDQKPSVL
ncbi:hypothetical protein QQX98_010203 [Neonectria punicea]|uniref:Uncharacterized protein n=1 Tax=Neonectria punicea TaxID=979145 RepID=A0ABR1GQJ8_9HYPO